MQVGHPVQLQGFHDSVEGHANAHGGDEETNDAGCRVDSSRPKPLLQAFGAVQAQVIPSLENFDSRGDSRISSYLIQEANDGGSPWLFRFELILMRA
jgi:hypothetical protein